jgi:hypothetical protein
MINLLTSLRIFQPKVVSVINKNIKCARSSRDPQVRKSLSMILILHAKVIFYDRYKGTTLVYFQRSDGFNDFLIDVVIGNLPHLAGIHEHPMKFGIDFSRLGKMIPKGGFNR